MRVPCGLPCLLAMAEEFLRDFKQLKGQEERRRVGSARGRVRVGQVCPTEGGDRGT